MASELWIYDANKSQGFLDRDLFVWIWFCSWKETYFYLLTFCSHSSSDTACLIFSIWQKPLFSSILHLDSQSVRTAFPCSCTDFIWLLLKIINPCFTESYAQRGTVLRLERLLCNWKHLLLLQRTLEWLPRSCLKLQCRALTPSSSLCEQQACMWYSWHACGQNTIHII